GRYGLRAQSHPDHRALPSRARQRWQRRRLLGRPRTADQTAIARTRRRGVAVGAIASTPTASYGGAMRVLITRPEREATALATALGERGHMPVIAPLFRLEILRPPPPLPPPLAPSPPPPPPNA